MIPDLCWVKQGVSKAEPDVIKLSEDEIKELISNTQKNLNIDEGEEVEENEDSNVMEDLAQGHNTTKLDKKIPSNDPDNIDEFNMEGYDDEDDESIAQKIFGAGLGGVAYYAKPEEDPYITLPAIARDDEDSYEVKATDNLICCAKLDGDMSSIEVHLWNGEEEEFYVHHDILLDTFPLCLEWLSFDPGSDDQTEGSFVAVGCMNPQVQIWDLDVINTTEPVTILGERRKQSSKKPKIGTKGHSDAVMSVGWNTRTKNVLASGSADKHVLLWDLETGLAKEVLNHHTDKIQTLSWHLAECQTILTGGYDHTCHVVDCRTKSSKKWKLSGEIEQVLWDVTNPYAFLAGTASGDVFCIDIRQDKPLYTLSAHSNEVSGLTMNRNLPGCLVTCSADKIVKVWDIKENKPTCIHARDFTDTISLHCIDFCPDNKYMLAIGGLEGGLLMWDIGTNKEVRDHFG